ncbi:MAG: hypothetical protein PHX93_03300, partial [Candidatus Peribacteraceae bacterium]|nr:hypothetical protein [Candidatus Peribacteraceae bacterium]
SVFFGVNMFKVEKRATTSYKVPFSGTRNRTLSGTRSQAISMRNPCIGGIVCRRSEFQVLYRSRTPIFFSMKRKFVDREKWTVILTSVVVPADSR